MTTHENTTIATTAEPIPPLSPEEQETLDDLAYLSSVTYLRFTLTGEDAPYFMGRWYDKELVGKPHKVTTNSGSSLYFMTNKTTRIKVNFTPLGDISARFAYSIDGAAPVRQHIMDPFITLPDSGRHTVRIFTDGIMESIHKWEQGNGFALRNVESFDAGGVIRGIKPQNRVIFYYGDSITEGIACLASGSNSEYHSATSAYPWVSSEALGAVPYLIGYGATGIMREGSFKSMMYAIDYYCLGREVNDGIQPDIIVINHGCNDTYFNDEPLFREKLTETLAHLREKYPNAAIVYLIPFNQAYASTITSVMQGVTNGRVISTQGWNLTFTDGVHPNVAGAKKAGENLAAALEEIFGRSYFQ